MTPRRAFIGIAALAALAAAAFGLQWLSRAPIALAFEPAAAELAASADAAAPRRARYNSSSDKITPFEPCFDGQREPLVVGGETLIFKVRARDDWPLVGWWRPPRLFVVSVSRAADPVVLDAARFKAINPANATPANGLTAAIPIEAVEDEIRLFVVATRDPALDAMRAAKRTTRGAAGSQRRRRADDDGFFPDGSPRQCHRLPIQGDQ